jgi:DNA mismatch endonuclease (patch repair protein)
MPRRTDTVSPALRSAIMRAVRSRGNKATELVLASLLRRHRIRGWRRGFRLVGQPDFVFPKQRVALFVDGCFWHGCPRHCRMPKGNRPYWRPKIAANRARDRRVNRTLRAAGWRVVRLWEHELRQPDRSLARIRRALAGREAECVGVVG